MRKRKETIYHYEIVLEHNSEGYTVTVPKLPGLVTEGRNLKEARDMAKDAIRCYLGALLKDKALSRQGTAVKRSRLTVAY